MSNRDNPGRTPFRIFLSLYQFAAVAMVATGFFLNRTLDESSQIAKVLMLGGALTFVAASLLSYLQGEGGLAMERFLRPLTRMLSQRSESSKGIVADLISKTDDLSRKLDAYEKGGGLQNATELRW